jgi:phage tail protein X
MPQDKYTTALGDEWDGIARRVYGDIRKSDMLVHYLLEANPEHRETVIFGAGTVLDIPPPPEPRVASLPPWMR